MSASVELNHLIVIVELSHPSHMASAIIRDTDYAPRIVYKVLSNLRQGKDCKGGS